MIQRTQSGQRHERLIKSSSEEHTQASFKHFPHFLLAFLFFQVIFSENIMLELKSLLMR